MVYDTVSYLVRLKFNIVYMGMYHMLCSIDGVLSMCTYPMRMSLCVYDIESIITEGL